jgi:hypothetical protein
MKLFQRLFFIACIFQRLSNRLSNDLLRNKRKQEAVKPVNTGQQPHQTAAVRSTQYGQPFLFIEYWTGT